VRPRCGELPAEKKNQGWWTLPLVMGGKKEGLFVGVKKKGGWAASAKMCQKKSVRKDEERPKKEEQM